MRIAAVILVLGSWIGLAATLAVAASRATEPPPIYERACLTVRA